MSWDLRGSLNGPNSILRFVNEYSGPETVHFWHTRAKLWPSNGWERYSWETQKDPVRPKAWDEFCLSHGIAHQNAPPHHTRNWMVSRSASIAPYWIGYYRPSLKPTLQSGFGKKLLIMRCHSWIFHRLKRIFIEAVQTYLETSTTFVHSTPTLWMRGVQDAYGSG